MTGDEVKYKLDSSSSSLFGNVEVWDTETFGSVHTKSYIMTAVGSTLHSS